MKLIVVQSLLFVLVLLVVTQVLIPLASGHRLFWLFTKEKEKPTVKIDSIERLKQDSNEAVNNLNKVKDQANQVSEEINQIKQKLS
jgi:lipopolysaccharide export LptBFGC system permease protein LptF